MINFLKDDDKFVFNGMFLAPTGKKEGPEKVLTVQYLRIQGNLKIILNAISKEANIEELKAKKELTYKEFIEEYAEHRAYFDGYIDLDQLIITKEPVDK